ncbi:hypothetical protein [Planotetraspora sp. GP83]|uniref:hypothetical protein n=1 Tax=Planotetraspora sp. GP83 TaxID=3156264 RepID=UPI003515A64F
MNEPRDVDTATDDMPEGYSELLSDIIREIKAFQESVDPEILDLLLEGVDEDED